MTVSNNFDKVAFGDLLLKFALSGIPSHKISQRLSKYLLDKKAPPKLCLEVMSALMDRLQDKPLYR